MIKENKRKTPQENSSLLVFSFSLKSYFHLNAKQIFMALIWPRPGRRPAATLRPASRRFPLYVFAAPFLKPDFHRNRPSYSRDSR